MGKNLEICPIFLIYFLLLKNYNKNRIHSSRGAKDVEISLDGQVIFKGEVSQACGNIIATNDPSAYGEVRIFYYRQKEKEMI